MKTKTLSALSIMLMSALTMGSLWLASPAQARFGGLGLDGLEKSLNQEISKTDDGIVITLTTDDAELLEKLQSREPRQPGHGSFSISKENLNNGIRITKTTEDPNVLEHLHRKADHILERQSITHSVENTDKGIVITITSTDADVIEKIQSKEPHKHRREDIEFVKENLVDGVRITITSEDPELVEKIQKHAKKRKHGKRRFQHGKQGKRKNAQ